MAASRPVPGPVTAPLAPSVPVPAPLPGAGPHPLAEPAQPGDLLLYRLVKLAASSGRLITRLCERTHGITRREWGVLMWLAQEPGLPPSVLAQRLELDRARVSRAVTSLQAKGLVRKSAAPAGQPASALHLTEAGTRLHAALWPQVRAINQQLARSLEADHLEQLARGLALLQEEAARLERHAPEAPPFPPRSGGARHREPAGGPRAS